MRAGEEHLAWAVLKSGIEEALGRFSGRHGRARIQAAALAWLKSDDELAPFSFVGMCELFGLEPAGLRRRVLSGVESLPVLAPRRGLPRTLSARRELWRQGLERCVLSGENDVSSQV
jgi:hypothetical protein